MSLAQPRPVPPGTDTAAEPARLNVVEASAAAADPDLPQARPLPGQVRAERHAEPRGDGGGVRIARDHQGARSQRLTASTALARPKSPRPIRAVPRLKGSGLKSLCSQKKNSYRIDV